MSGLSIQAKNRLEHGDVVSQELPATQIGYRRWTAIYPLTEERLQKKYGKSKYKLIDFELASHLVNEFFSEDDKRESKKVIVDSDFDLLRILEQAGIDAAKFEAPWRNDYPL